MGAFEILMEIFTLGYSLYQKWKDGNEQEKEAALAEARAALAAAKNERAQTEARHKQLWELGASPAAATDSKAASFETEKVNPIEEAVKRFMEGDKSALTKPGDPTDPSDA